MCWSVSTQRNWDAVFFRKPVDPHRGCLPRRRDRTQDHREVKRTRVHERFYGERADETAAPDDPCSGDHESQGCPTWRSKVCHATLGNQEHLRFWYFPEEDLEQLLHSDGEDRGLHIIVRLIKRMDKKIDVEVRGRKDDRSGFPDDCARKRGE